MHNCQLYFLFVKCLLQILHYNFFLCCLSSWVIRVLFWVFQVHRAIKSQTWLSMHINTTVLCTFFTKSFKIYILWIYFQVMIIYFYFFYCVLQRREYFLFLVKSNLSNPHLLCVCVLSKNCQRFSFMFSSRVFIILKLISRSWKFSINLNLSQ